MITKSSIYHKPKSNYCYAYDFDTLHIRIRTAKGEVDKVTLRIGDPYDWAKGGGGGNLNNENAFGWVGGENIPMTKEAETDLFDYWFATAQPEYKRARYAFVLESADEIVLYGEKRIVDVTSFEDKALQDMGNFFCFPYLNKIDVFDAPEWVKDTIWYQIFPERFDNGNPSISPSNALPWGSKDPHYDSFFGGDIQGIINHLDYLQNLGINGIYLTPIFEGRSNHKYDTINYFEVDPHFGDKAVLKQFIDEAHKRGIRIMFDAVFNHIGWFSEQWQDVLENGKNSKYVDWFHIRKFPVLSKKVEQIRNKDGLNYETFAFTPYMPKLNTENPEVKEFLLEVGRYWVREFNIDAWRLDVSNEVDHSFWRDFRREVKAINKDCYILGEIWHDSLPWLKGDQFDAVMNYPLTDAIVNYFANNRLDATEFAYAVNNVNISYPQSVNEVSFLLLDSHDTARIIHKCGGDKRKAYLAYLFQFTHTGTPCVYYGGEIGLDGGDDPLCRKCMIWDEKKQDLNMKEHIMKLIQLRKEHPAFKASSLEWIEINNESNYVIYKKQSEDEEVVVVINNSGKEISIKLPEILEDRTVYELYHDKPYILSDSITLGAYGFNIYKL